MLRNRRVSTPEGSCHAVVGCLEPRSTGRLLPRTYEKSALSEVWCIEVAPYYYPWGKASRNLLSFSAGMSVETISKSS
jgi:hypothetical protein